jgi:hypothetical protein
VNKYDNPLNMPKEPPPYQATADELRAIDQALAERQPLRRSLQNQPQHRLVLRPKLKTRPASKGRVHKGRTGR